jgi:mannose-6-phosphate isomerase-like protein (cupin superfamily)
MRPLRAMLFVIPIVSLSVLAQGTAGARAVYLTGAVAADAAAGAAVTISPGIAVRRRSGAGEPQYAIVHPFSTEIYYIVEGTGTLVTGGMLEMPLAPSTDPDVVRSKAIKDGVTRKVATGDVIVVPPGTPHWFSAIDGTITYLESRVRVK